MEAAKAVLAGDKTQADAARHHGVSRQAVNRALARLKKRAGQIAGKEGGIMIVDDPLDREAS
jgi:hypothetical protein